MKKVIKMKAVKDKKVSKKTAPKKEEDTSIRTVKFYVYGYGREMCCTELTPEQHKYWKAKFDDENSDASSELQDHVWNFGYDEEPKDYEFGRWYDCDSMLHMERPHYDASNKLTLEVYKDNTLEEEITLDVTDKKIKKEIGVELDLYNPTYKGRSFLFTASSDKGSYLEGMFNLEMGEKFDLKKLKLIVDYIVDGKYITDISYNGETLDNEGCQSSTGKGFDSEIFWR